MSKLLSKLLSKYRLPLLSGLLIGTSYIPFPPWALFFSLVPLWLFWWEEADYKRVFWAGWATQFMANAIGGHWVAYTTVEFGQMPWPIGLVALFLFCSFACLYYPVAGVLWKWTCQKLKVGQTASFLLLPVFLLFCERLYPVLFYWHLGYPWLWAGFPGFHLGEYVGFFGLHLITLYINTLVALFWLRRRPQQWFQPHLVGALLLFFSINLLGFLRSQSLPEPDQSLRVLAVQGNIGNLEKVYAQKGPGFRAHIVDRFINLTKQGLEENPGVDLVIWPETAFPETIKGTYINPQRQRLARLTEDYDVELLTGAYQRKKRGGPLYNALVLMKGTEIRDDYQKTILLAFGEYLPFSQYYPPLRKLLPNVSNFGRGLGPKPLQSKKARIGPQICYEGLSDQFSAQLQAQKVQILVNVSNDSWFGSPFEPYQHMYMTLARGVENRLPLIRVTNTGISTVIRQDGKKLESSPLHEQWYKVYDIPYHSEPPPTFYAKVWDKWPLIFLLLMGLILGADRIARRIHRTKQH